MKQIEIIPSKVTMIDKELNIKLHGFQPDQEVLIKASSHDDNGTLWESFAVFKTDSNGSIFLDRQKPLSGTYKNADSMGLFWSMRPQSKTNESHYIKRNLKPMIINFTVEHDKKEIISESIERLIIADNIIKKKVRENGIVGTFFRPDDNKSHPCIIVLSGSDGGMYEHTAALLASYGYCTLSLAYFKEESLPKYLSEIPLEYFESAILWLQNQPSVNSNNLGILAYSMGANLALLLGTMISDIKSIICFSSNGFIWQGLERKGININNTSSFTLNHKPLPYIPYKITLKTKIKFIFDKLTGKPMKLLPMYQDSLNQATADILEEASIKIEKIKASLLFISGGDDKVWPSSNLFNDITKHLSKNNYQYPFKHISYKGAGHIFMFPYRPTFFVSQNREYSFGGKPEMDYYAQVDSWKKVIQTFNNYLKNS